MDITQQLLYNNRYTICLRYIMRTMSISLTEELYEKIKRMIPSKQVSKFIASAATRELKAKEDYLKACYIEADQDEILKTELDEWDLFHD